MIPVLFEQGESNFRNNGICRLYDTIEAVCVEERNGIYELDFTYPVNGANFNEIKCGRIIGVWHDETEDLQPFDIVSFERPINGIVSFHAVHVSYRLTGAVVEAENISTLADALNALGNSTPSTPFEFTADFTSGAYAAAFDGVPRSVRQLLGGVRGSILDAYGGEYEFDGFRVILHKKRGQILDFPIRYGVNMADYDEAVDYEGTYTAAVPFWKGDDGNGGETIIKGNPVFSGLVPFNGIERCVPLDFSEKYESAPTTAELEALALSTMTNGAANMPSQNIKVDFVRLQDLPEYSNIAPLLSCKLCDEINVIFPDYNTVGHFKIVRTVYNVLAERYDEMELGNLSTTLAQALGVNGETTGTSSGFDDSNLVHKDGAETITGFKTFTNGAKITRSTSGAILELESAAADTNFLLKRTNGSQCVLESGASVGLFGTKSNHPLQVRTNYTNRMTFGTDGSVKLATAPASSSNDNQLASTKWVRDYTPQIVVGSYVYNGSSTSTITFTDANISGKTKIICGAQDAGNPPLRASISGTTITVYLSDAVSIMRVNYICY